MPYRISFLLQSLLLITMLFGAWNVKAEKSNFTDMYKFELKYKTAGNWKIADGKLFAEAHGKRQNAKLFSLEKYRNFSLNTEMVFLNPKNKLAICFRASSESRYTLYIYPQGLVRIVARILKPEAKQIQLAAKQIKPLKLNVPYSLQVATVGNQILVNLVSSTGDSKVMLSTQAETLDSIAESPVIIELQRDATPGNYALEIRYLEIKSIKKKYLEDLLKKNSKKPLKNIDMSNYEDRMVLLGYPTLINVQDKKNIFSRETKFCDLKYNLRMVGWTYGDISREEAENNVKKLKAAGFNTVISAGNRYILKNLGTNIKNSKIIADACHKYGMKFIHHLTTTLVKKEFSRKNLQYSCININTQKPLFTHYNRYAACFNNDEFWSEFMKRLEELLRQVKMDGIMIDEICFWGDETCGCDWCRKKFKLATGHEIPKSPGKNFFRNLDNPIYKKWLLWRADEIRKRKLGIKKLIKKYMPNGGFYPSYQCDPTVAGRWNAFYRCGLRLVDLIPNSSSIGNEFEPTAFNYFYTWPVAIAEMKYVKAANRTLNANPWFYFYPTKYGDYVWCALMSMTMGSNIWFPGENTPSENIEKCRRPILGWMAKYQDILGNTSPFSNTGVLWSVNTRDFCSEGLEWRQGYIGVCQLLTDSQTAYRVLLDQDLGSGGLKGLKTLALFNTVCVSNANLKSIRDFVKNGGTLIASGKVSLRDEYGKSRNDFGLAELFGFSYSSYIKDNANSLIIPEKSKKITGVAGKITHNKGFVRLKNIADDSIVIGKIKDLSGKEFPGIVIRNYGKGKILYFCGHPELHYMNQDLIKPNRLPFGGVWKDKRNPEYCKMITSAISYLNSEPTLRVENLPRGVVVEAYHQQGNEIKGVAVHLANFSGADLKAGIIPKNFDITFPKVMPANGIRVAVKAKKINRVFLISPDFKKIIDLPFTMKDGYAKVNISTLYRYSLLYFVKSGVQNIIDIAGIPPLKNIPEPVKMVYMKKPAVIGKYNPQDIVFWADNRKLRGGYYYDRMIGGAVKLVYGSMSKYSTVKLKFKLPRYPKRLTVLFGGSEYTLPERKIPVKISLNGKVVFKGNDPFPKGECHGVKSIEVEPKFLKPEENEIEISNLYPSFHGKPPYLKISFVKIAPRY